MTIPTPQSETPETDALIAYHTAESEQLSERVPVANDATWLAHSVQQIRELVKLTRSLEARLLARRTEREGKAQQDAVTSSTGAECAACGFRYSAYKGHIIPCPRCAAEAAERGREGK